MFYSYLRPLLFLLPPESAHTLTLALLALRGMIFPARPITASTSITVMGIAFPNPIGLAAGFDKDGHAIKGIASLGFGFIEVGTVTPRPQAGNPRPRLFRIPEAEAVINRLGFNNAGIDALIKRMRTISIPTPIGINLGKNADTPIEQAVEDYRIGLRAAYPFASYITINISSPNTAGLRSLQHGSLLKNLLLDLKNEQQKLHALHQRYVPLVVKLAPDLSDSEIESIAGILLDTKIDGVIATNTTQQRPASIASLAHAAETGGLSGKPLAPFALHTLKELARHLDGKIPLIAAGGISSAQDVSERLAAGASLVQLYTSLIYQGPSLVKTLLT